MHHTICHLNTCGKGSVANIGQGRKNSISRTQLSSESKELRKAVPCQTKLFLADHLSHPDAFEGSVAKFPLFCATPNFAICLPKKPKGSHYPKDVILFAVFCYVRYAVSYRDLEEILEERGVVVDHATLNHWVVKFSPLIAANA